MSEFVQHYLDEFGRKEVHRFLTRSGEYSGCSRRDLYNRASLLRRFPQTRSGYETEFKGEGRNPCQFWHLLYAPRPQGAGDWDTRPPTVEVRPASGDGDMTTAGAGVRCTQLPAGAKTL